MFAAVGLFVVLLIAMLAIAYMRFRDPPEPARTPPPAAGAVPAPLDPAASGAGARAALLAGNGPAPRATWRSSNG